MMIQSALAADLPARDVEKSGRGVRWRGWGTFALFVILPTALAVAYYGLIASDQYVSESRFVIKAQNDANPPISLASKVMQTTGLSAGHEQTNEVMDYIRSRDALMEVQEKIDLRVKFGAGGTDFISRYPEFLADDRFENLYRYYKSKVSVRLDTGTGVAVLTVRAFTAEDARDLNARLLGASEALINRLNDRARSRAIIEAQGRVLAAERRLRDARSALGAYRNAEDLLDPGKQAAAVLEITNGLVAERAALQIQLDQIEQAAPDNPAIAELRARIAGIDGQIAAQTRRAVGTSGSIASRMGGYEERLVEQEFATKMLEAAGTSLEQARTEAQQQQFYLERLVEPNRPDLALFPHRLRAILTVAAAALCLYLIGWMLVAGILEHAPED